MIFKAIVSFLIVALAAGGAYALITTAPKLTPSAPEPRPVTVRVTTIEAKPVQLTVPSQGTVTPRMESELVPEVSGRAVWVSPNLVAGGAFAEGELLLRVDSADYRAQVSRAQANVTRAQADAEHARFEYNRFRQLQQRQLASASQSENARRSMRVADANYQDARVALEQAQRDLSRSEITAPFTGRVRNERVDVGQFVARGNSIATLYASENIEVRLPIADDQLAYLNIPVGHHGQLDPDSAPKVRLFANFGGQRLEWQGRVVRTEAEIDAKTRMVNVIAQIEDESDKRQPGVGMFINADIQGRLAANVVTLPRTALRNDNRVLVVDADNRLYHRTVVPLRFYQDQVLIQSGLEDGDVVCISNLQTVIDGMRVNPLYQDGSGPTVSPPPAADAPTIAVTDES